MARRHDGRPTAPARSAPAHSAPAHSAPHNSGHRYDIYSCNDNAHQPPPTSHYPTVHEHPDSRHRPYTRTWYGRNRVPELDQSQAYYGGMGGGMGAYPGMMGQMGGMGMGGMPMNGMYPGMMGGGMGGYQGMTGIGGGYSVCLFHPSFRLRSYVPLTKSGEQMPRYGQG